MKLYCEGIVKLLLQLLVNKKIISLDLPVNEVYKKIWAPEHGEGEPMPIIYRMRGLLGDATEDMVNSLESNSGTGHQCKSSCTYVLFIYLCLYISMPYCYHPL